MKSLWIETTKDKLKLESLKNDEETEICIIGGGLFGLTTAYYLTKQGKKVIVLEKGEIGEKVSGNTTAKITSQHGLFYDHLIQDYGKEYAKKYLEANEKAIENIAKIIDDEKIDCDFSRQKAYVYTIKDDEINNIKREVKAVNELGKKAKFVTELDLPFEIKGAIEFENQAEYHARKYMLGLCDVILKENKIYEYTTVTDIKNKGEKYEIYTDKGIVRAKYVVLATHYPIINTPGFYFTKMYQSTSYLMAIETNEKIPQEMYITVQNPVYTFRKALYNGKEILIFGGCDHKTGEAINDTTNYDDLEEKIREWYPDAKILFKWNTRDCISLDKIPYIGEFSNLMKNMYVGTGFKKWGMTFSNIAANIVVDMILGKKNEYAEIFDSTRLKPIKNRWEMGNMLEQSINSVVLNKFKIEPEDIENIENDNGAIVKIKGVNIGIYKNADGKIYAVKPNCTHLGCLLSWNNLDKTWDCPCHGSRFDYKGQNIYEPAIKNLELINIDFQE